MADIIKYTDNIPIILIIENKCDLVKERKVTKEDKKLLEKQTGIHIIEVSAKNSFKINESMEMIVKKIIQKSENGKTEIYNIDTEKLTFSQESNSENEINNLKSELSKANKIINEQKLIIQEFKNKLNALKNDINNLNNNITNYKNIITKKDIELNNLRTQLSSNNNNNIINNFNLNEMMCVNFISGDQQVHFAVPCLKSNTFAEVEEKLYQQYPAYRETNNNFIANGSLVLRFKTIGENKIGNGKPVTLLIPS